MIDVRTFEGDAAEAADFTVQVWADRYAAKSPIINWSRDFFEWQLFWNRPGGRDFLVAAYDGNTLVGTLFAERMQFHLRGKPFIATMGSWLSVHRDYQGQGIARMLTAEQRRRHRALDAKFMMGFGVLGTDGPKYWGTEADTRVNGTFGFWVRVLDRPRVTDWVLKRSDRAATRFAHTVLGGIPRETTAPDVRPFEASDLGACLELVEPLQRSSDLGYRWTEERLAHQLAGTHMARTLVLERQGRVAGFVNYYVVGMTGRTHMPVAIIDLIAVDGLTPVERTRLVNVAFGDMARAGAALAMMMRLPCYPWLTFMRLGFAPTPRDMSFLFLVLDPGFPVADIRRFHVTWR